MDSGITARQQRSFDFFRLRTAVELAGPFGADLWSTILLRTAHDESSIFNAVVALGALHENYGYSRDAHATYSDYALTYYQKAIQRIITLNNINLTLHTDIVLMMCTVFSAFDSLRGHYKASLMHIASGIKILVEADKRLGGLRDGSLQKDVFLPLFVQLERQITDVGQKSAVVNTTRLIQQPILSIPSTFKSVDEAHIMFSLALTSMWNMLAKPEENSEHPTSSHLQLESHHNYDGLAKWLDPLDPAQEQVDCFACQTPPIRGVSMLDHFSSWCAAFDASDFPPFHPAVQILQMNRLMLSLLLRADIKMGEMVWDSYLPQFQELLDYAESVLPNRYRNSPVEKGAPPTFHYHLGLLKPIYFVCTRCRDPVTRRRALRLLEHSNRKEGIWDSVIGTRISKQIIEIEEGAAFEAMSKSSIGPKPGGWVVERAEQIKENFRRMYMIQNIMIAAGHVKPLDFHRRVEQFRLHHYWTGIFEIKSKSKLSKALSTHPIWRVQYIAQRIQYHTTEKILARKKAQLIMKELQKWAELGIVRQHRRSL
ncbi:hypothetical protein DSL72_004684 [Monilinia vaccinii-corymbosi]|uniref:Uncharacterized protein n=1 Tax=Monilinia vaccinii-corymbosi TaxID=61207 RepID=A0A8A3P2V1_9HELO|nr:hypothetical protein DSL72_004684 [Monilinia vaccinii-corymbosi]